MRVVELPKEVAKDNWRIPRDLRREEGTVSWFLRAYTSNCEMMKGGPFSVRRLPSSSAPGRLIVCCMCTAFL